jgi:hypothetical protein
MTPSRDVAITWNLEDWEMPFYLKEADILPRVAGLRSVLIVPCRFCPAASLAVREKMPYIELFRRFLRTEAYELFIKSVKRRLEDEGIRTEVFDSKMPHHYVACMWTSKRRQKLAKRAAEFDGVVVLGCDATTETVREAVKPADFQIIQGMEMEGIMNILPTVSLPFNISIELQGMTPVTTNGSDQRQEEHAS